jgi:radical SAM superfamily enzyme YgiQ (UPF0313 family)
MPTVLVINPWVADFKLYDEWMHPLGLYFLVSLLEKNGARVHFFDCLNRSPQAHSRKFGTGVFQSRQVEKPSLYRSIPRKYKLYGRPAGELNTFLSRHSAPDLICIGSMMTYWLPGVAETIKTVRTVHPDVPLLVGGVAARLMPDVIRNLALGVAVNDSLEGNVPLRLHASLPSLEREETPSLLGGLGKIENALHGPVLMSLGCPMACSYCASSLLQGKFRLRSRERVIEEVLFLAKERGVGDFAFFDDALLYRADEGIIPLLNGLSARSGAGRLRFHAPNGLHSRYVDEATAAALKSAGFTTLRFGYENGSEVYCRDTSRKTDRGELLRKLAILKSAGFTRDEIGVYVMAGLPGQTPAQVHEELDYVASCGVKVKPVYLSPVPGTLLFETYAAAFPQIRSDPLWHNDTFFLTQLPGWNWDEMEKIRVRVRELNR